jgi:hypothetical protein
MRGIEPRISAANRDGLNGWQIDHVLSRTE